MRQSSQVNLDAKRGSRSLMTRKGNPNRVKICLTYNRAVPSAVISSVQGINTDALVQSWLVTVRIASYPWDLGNLVMKLSAITSKGVCVWLRRNRCKWGSCGPGIDLVPLTLRAPLDVLHDVSS